MSNKTEFIENYIKGLQELLSELDPAAINRAIMWFREAHDENRTIFTCGNGGSASISSHLVVDLLKGASYGYSRRFRIIGLADSIATITAYANDVSYDRVFVEQLKNFAKPGDVLAAFSGSGNSANVLRAVEYANEAGLKTIGFTTSLGGALRDMVQLPLILPTSHMGHLEDSFFIIVHILCYAFIEDKDF